MRTSFAPLHPGALAVAGGAAAVILALITGVGMMGAGSMMDSGWMMGGSYGHTPYGFGFFMLLWAVVVGALGGFIVALVYNAVVSQASSQRDSGSVPARNG